MGALAVSYTHLDVYKRQPPTTHKSPSQEEFYFPKILKYLLDYSHGAMNTQVVA